MWHVFQLIPPISGFPVVTPAVAIRIAEGLCFGWAKVPKRPTEPAAAVWGGKPRRSKAARGASRVGESTLESWASRSPSRGNGIHGAIMERYNGGIGSGPSDAKRIF